MDTAARSFVRERANHRCEYCHRRQVDSPLIPLQIEHVIPRKHGGDDELGNLALACAECNLHKGCNLTGIDPETNQITLLFDPRHAKWEDHFSWNGVHIVGSTAIGRTTIRVLGLNAPARIGTRLGTRSV